MENEVMNKNMVSKRFGTAHRALALGLVMSVGLVLAACGGGDNFSPPAPTPAPAPAPAPTPGPTPTPATYTIGGTVSGIPAGLTISLLDNGGDQLTGVGNGAFTFKTALTASASYAVTAEPTTGVSCSVSSGSGNVGTANVTNVQVACQAVQWMQVMPTGSAPQARYGSTSWTDASGNFWLFGGYDGTAFTSDLWEYVPAGTNGQTGQWTQVMPTGTVPSARVGGTHWTDASGNLWLFGGVDPTLGAFDDLWEYVPAGTNGQAGQWTQVIPTGAMPSARNASASWTDANGNLWLFGGADSTGSPLGDLWEYVPAGTNGQAGQWTQVIPTGAMPSARNASASWTDANGNLWLFGGADSTGSSLDDLWEYVPAGTNGQAGQWTQATTSTAPPARTNSATWTDASGNLWLFGGQGNLFTLLGDMWEYTPSGTNGQAGQWTQVTSTGAVPSARYGGANWMDANGNLWLFGGGNNSGELGDLWMYP